LSNTQHEYDVIPLDPVTKAATVEVDINDYASVVLVGVNLSEFSAASGFQYSAIEKSPYEVSSEIFGDPIIYSGDEREFEYRVTNPATVSSLYNITGFDNAGWVIESPQQIFLSPGQSQSVMMSVKPPVGTPIGVTSACRFRATSLSDPLVFDEQTIVPQTVLQRGDVDFNGSVDIADLTELISSLFISFDPIEPEPEAGNIDCAGTVDIVDLTFLISWLFIDFTGSPCNPY
jgi:hypothetical protein